MTGDDLWMSDADSRFDAQPSRPPQFALISGDRPEQSMPDKWDGLSVESQVVTHHYGNYLQNDSFERCNRHDSGLDAYYMPIYGLGPDAAWRSVGPGAEPGPSKR